MKNSFFLVIPKQQKNSQRLVEYEAKAIQQWISELPAGNPGLATRLLHDFIIESNTVEMPGSQRLDVLELLKPSALAIEDNLRSRLIKSGFPKEENEHKILNVLVSIEKEFAIGYWIVLKEFSQRPVGWFQGKTVALALQRCIRKLGCIVTSHFIMGMPVPDWIWIDLHSLYRLGTKLNINNKPVAADPGRPAHKSTPEQCYKQVLLLSLTDATGLMQKEIPLVDHYIETLAPLVNLQNRPSLSQPMQCIVLTDEDKPPLFQAQTGAAGDHSILYLDLTKLYKALDQKLKANSVPDGRFSSMQLSSHPDQPASELLEYLKHRWSGIELQSSSLFGDRLDRSIVIGLAASHALKGQTDSTADSPGEIRAESKSDSLLSCQFEQPGMLSVGSLISFRKADNIDGQRSIAVVNRVIVNKQSSKINFGIQLLAPFYHAVSYSLPNASKNEEPQKALFYSMTENGIEKTNIITDSFLLKVGDIIRMQWKSDDFPILLNDRKNIGLGYWQFSCVKIVEKDKQATAKKGYDFI
ncbi:MAG: hypothetical protein ACU841_01970 [Gammaproteobacteria bacterium]